MLYHIKKIIILFLVLIVTISTSGISLFMHKCYDTNSIKTTFINLSSLCDHNDKDKDCICSSCVISENISKNDLIYNYFFSNKCCANHKITISFDNLFINIYEKVIVVKELLSSLFLLYTENFQCDLSTSSSQEFLYKNSLFSHYLKRPFWLCNQNFQL